MRARQCVPMYLMLAMVGSWWLEMGTEWVRRYCHRECRGDLDEAHVEKMMLAAEHAKQHDRR